MFVCRQKINFTIHAFMEILQWYETYFGYFGHAWLHSPKMIVSTCRRLQCLSACKKQTSPGFWYENNLILLLACLYWHCVKFCYHWSFAIILLCLIGVAWISCKKYNTHCNAGVFWRYPFQIQNFGPTFQTNTFNFVNVTERGIVSISFDFS